MTVAPDRLCLQSLHLLERLSLILEPRTDFKEEAIMTRPRDTAALTQPSAGSGIEKLKQTGRQKTAPQNGTSYSPQAGILFVHV